MCEGKLEKFLVEELELTRDNNPVREFLDSSEIKFRSTVLVGFESLLESLEKKDQEIQELRDHLHRLSRSKLDGVVYGAKL